MGYFLPDSHEQSIISSYEDRVEPPSFTVKWWWMLKCVQRDCSDSWLDCGASKSTHLDPFVPKSGKLISWQHAKFIPACSCINRAEISWQHYLEGDLFGFSFYFEVTVLASVVVVRCFLHAELTNLSSSERREIDKVILDQIILCLACCL